MASGAPINKIERAHQMYREGSYEEALVFYTEALSMAKIKSQKIALHSNRAACYLKLHHFKKAAEECTSVLDLDHKHTGALMLRAQTLVTLKEYQSALFDVNRLIDLNPSSEVYQNLQARLKTQLSLAPIPEAEMELEDDEDRDEAEQKEEEGEQVEGELETHEDKEEGQVEGELEQDAEVLINQNTENRGGAPTNEVITLQTFDPSQKADKVTDQNQSLKGSSEQNSSGWKTIPKPKGHSHLDYSRWDRVEDDSSEDDDDEEDEESQPQYRFRVRTVGVRPVK